jgi:hypothetical protein
LNWLRAGFLSIALMIALMPEAGRFAAEHRLYAATAAFQMVISRDDRIGDRIPILDSVVNSATGAADELHGDARPWILAGSARLLEHRPDQALVFYRKALLLGERAEIDLNLGRAYEMLGNRRAASAAILRAGWVSPAVVSSLPDEIQRLVNSAIDENNRRLRAHRLSAPPPLPADDRAE